MCPFLRFTFSRAVMHVAIDNAHLIIDLFLDILAALEGTVLLWGLNGSCR